MGKLMGEQNGDRANSIDIFRLVCALLVVVIHTAPFYEVNASFGFIVNQVFPRIAVPFFFTVAGFYYVQALLEGKRIFVKYITKTLRTYLFWSLFYFSIRFFELILRQEVGVEVLLSFIKSCCLNFCLYGSYYHFWFFPALLFSVVIVTLFFKIKGLNFIFVLSIVFYIIGSLGCSYYQLAIEIPVLSFLVQSKWFELIRRILLMGLPFFCLGGILNIKKKWWDKIKIKMQWIVMLGITILFFLEIAIVVSTNIYENIVLTFFLYPLVGWVFIILYNNPLRQAQKIGVVSRSYANFIYYIHPAIILGVERLSFMIFKLECPRTFLFLIVLGISIALRLLVDIRKIRNNNN